MCVCLQVTVTVTRCLMAASVTDTVTVDTRTNMGTDMEGTDTVMMDMDTVMVDTDTVMVDTMIMDTVTVSVYSCQ